MTRAVNPGELLNGARAQDVALRESERRFREMIDALPVAIYTTDAEGRLTHFNPAAVEFSGRTPELGSDQWCVSFKLYHPDGRPMAHDECPMAIALKEGRIIRGAEAIAERPDGKRVWFTPYPTPLRDGAGGIVGGMNMLLDITERKQAEKAQARLAAIVESSEDAIISKDLNGIIVSWNRAAERLFGYTAAEAAGKPITMLIPSERLAEEPDILMRIKRGERIEHYETVRQRKDGSLVDISLAISPIVDSGGKIIGASKIVRDITERRQAEAALQDNQTRLEMALEAAEVAARAKDHFLAALSHELRTPLTPVLITAALLREDETLPVEVRNSLEVIEQNIEMQARMVDDLLDYSRVINNKLELAVGPCNLREIIHRALDVCRAAGVQKGVAIGLELHARQHQLHADAMRLQQVFWNLIQNAIKFTPAGGHITIASHSGEDHLEVSVTDTGCGIDPALLEVIFNPFEQVHQKPASGGGQRGLGLGLAIARRVVAAHGGSITAASRGKGSGTKFVVRLPVSPPQSPS